MAEGSGYPKEPEFEQALAELKHTLEDSTLFEKHPDYKRALDVIQIPERVIQFRVVWEDDKGRMRVNRGYRVQQSSVLGPFKGGLRFHPTVNLSILRFLALEQTFKNALTGLSMGSGKGGADFDPKGCSEGEIRKFCVAFMTQLSRYIGATIDVPAGDMGVSTREIGYMFGRYRQAANTWEGMLTGKGADWGGSLIRPEATGFGLVYYVARMIEYAEKKPYAEAFKGKKVIISGSGNVSQYAALKAIELGATVLSLSDSGGALVSTSQTEGFTAEHITAIAEIKHKKGSLDSWYQSQSSLHKKFNYLKGARPWNKDMPKGIDIALPCATQNEVSGEEAKYLIDAGCRYVAEGSNMGCELEAIQAFEAARKRDGSIFYGPGKASNCGGVAVSGLEMAQNSQRVKWTADKVDEMLAEIMKNAFDLGLKTALEYSKEGKDSKLPSLVAGSNIAGFVKVAEAAKAQGDWF